MEQSITIDSWAPIAVGRVAMEDNAAAQAHFPVENNDSGCKCHQPRWLTMLTSPIFWLHINTAGGKMASSFLSVMNTKTALMVSDTPRLPCPITQGTNYTLYISIQTIRNDGLVVLVICMCVYTHKHTPEPPCRAACPPSSVDSSRTLPALDASSSRGAPWTPPETGSASSGPSHRWFSSCTGAKTEGSNQGSGLYSTLFCQQAFNRKLNVCGGRKDRLQ